MRASHYKQWLIYKTQKGENINSQQQTCQNITVGTQ